MLSIASTNCTKTVRVEVPVPVTDCIDEEPPEFDVDFSACDGFEACLTKENAGKLFKYLHGVKTYMDDWYSACGKKEK